MSSGFKHSQLIYIVLSNNVIRYTYLNIYIESVMHIFTFYTPI